MADGETGGMAAGASRSVQGAGLRSEGAGGRLWGWSAGLDGEVFLLKKNHRVQEPGQKHQNFPSFPVLHMDSSNQNPETLVDH